ncbi:hypothetical protein BDB00DRAFT_843225 [Zychaea mexicana]|uniref:uncharacterized protein n=1 Tax=Zychaea mexicana TaxID=64656 RepID=UPI0022FE5956|nr:uncharacterized protein BDB00DRAFT_843225 [Zychaea mexicana]KAI9489393.1 hypothetical protein BDB00DRAFT_843225 [Zychaea mexicana]
MFLLKTNPRKKTVLVIMIVFSLLMISLQLVRYQYDGIPLPSRLLQWSTDNYNEFMNNNGSTNGYDTGDNDDKNGSPRFLKSPQPQAIEHVPTSDEKYLTYLPYSRFSNQRSTLLNAALLAKYLNRTLIVPPMFLGSANGWSPAPGLYRVLANMTDDQFQDRCFDVEGNVIPEEPVWQGEEVAFGCYNFTTYAMLPWSWATDLHRLTRSEDEGGLGINIMERSDMSLVALQKELDLPEEELYLMQDNTRYQWHIYEKDGDPRNLRYQYEISLRELDGIQQRLLHFYGIFGYDRLELDSDESDEYRLRIEQALIFRHPAIGEASAMILGQLLNGIEKEESELVPLDPYQAQEKEDQEQEEYELPRFVAAHVRAGDGVFLKKLKDRVPEFVHQIWDIMTGNETTTDDLIGSTNKINATQPTVPRHKLFPLPKAPYELRKELSQMDLATRLSECAKRNEMVLYVATDAETPRQNKELKPIIDAFPCTFFMDDFPRDWRIPLTNVRSPLDPKKDLTEYLVMFVDATLCSWAERFVGTRTSTFSNYIKQFRHAIVDEMIERREFDA